MLVVLNCHAETNNLQELTGVFSVFKWPMELKIDGTSQSIDLEGDVLKGIPSGTRIWVQGEIQTVLMEAATNLNEQASWPKHWRVFIDVKSVMKIDHKFQRPKNAQNQPSDALARAAQR